jgi:Tfp pilus assembly protein PilP
MKRRSLRLLMFAAVTLCAFGSPTNAGIDRPAGEVPAQQRVGGVTNGMSLGTAKSRVIPVTRKMNLATAEQSSEKIENAGSPPKSSATKSAITKPSQTSPDPMDLSTITNASSKQRIPEADGRKPRLSVAMSQTQSWDSVSKRLSEEDPAHAVTQGVRVEDIVEPSADYQYVSGRRRNPFIPEVVRSRSSVQKELSPNDVEIPIINPLQSFELSKLAVIGVWEGGDHVWKALIQTPTNQGIETKLGDPAGNSGGRIMSITPDAVVVREFKLRSDGTREYRDVPLYMGSDKPKEDDSLVGGRLILKPGATAPEIEKPEVSSDAVIAPAAEIIPTEDPGTLKNRVRVQASAPQGAVSDRPVTAVPVSEGGLTPAVSEKQEGANSTLTAPAVQ